METPLPFAPAGRNTIFLILRSNTSPGKIFPISHWRETELPGQKGESSYDGIYVHVCVRTCIFVHLHICSLVGKCCP